MKRASLRLAGALAVLSLALILPGCRAGSGASRSTNWDEHWHELSSVRAYAPPGTTYETVTFRSTPEGLEQRRECWRLLDADSVNGRFEHVRETGGRSVQVMRMHPKGPTVFITNAPARHPVYSCGGPLRDLRVPAGEFRCGRTTRSFEAHDGVVMRVDEWWTPNVPVPIQRWTRWERYASDTLQDPPRAPSQLPVGTAWARLERIRRPS